MRGVTRRVVNPSNGALAGTLPYRRKRPSCLTASANPIRVRPVRTEWLLALDAVALFLRFSLQAPI